MSIPTLAAIRFGYGLSPEHPAPASAQALADALMGPDDAAARFPIAGIEARLVEIRALLEAKKAARSKDPADRERYKEARAQMQRAALEAMRARLQRAVLSPDGFRERLHGFWADHFSVRERAVTYVTLPSALGEDAIRPHLAGYFRDMLRAVVTHPAMLRYLDQFRSVGPNSPVGQRREAGLNENLAREILELHTLGVAADYTQDDVRQFALLLTGLGFDNQVGFKFDARRAEPGAFSVLGRSYGGGNRAKLDDIFAALDDIAAHPATAAHIARKIAVHFVSDNPDPAMVAAMTEAFTATGGHLPSVYAAMLSAPAAWAPEREKARQPWDFVVASLRALGVGAERLAAFKASDLRQRVVGPLARMGQPFLQAPGPDGWPEEAEAWITPPGLAERIRWALDAGALAGGELPDPRLLVETALADLASETLVTAARQSENRPEGVALVLASAEFNRR